MEKQDNFQLELFSQNADSDEIKRHTPNNAFLNYIRNFEKMILVIIGMATISIISYSLGVERGKNHIAAKTIIPMPVKIPNISDSLPRAIEKQNNIEQQKIKEDIWGFTIQLASYRTKTYAQKEADELKKKGFSPIIFTKGDYIVLCVGSFNNKESAQSMLSQFKNRYQGCYIRRL
jgi:hypothetical protein